MPSVWISHGYHQTLTPLIARTVSVIRVRGYPTKSSGEGGVFERPRYEFVDVGCYEYLIQSQDPSSRIDGRGVAFGD
jgi:hypothetical protein